VIHTRHLCQWLEDEGVTYFTGVPDSGLKQLCAYLADEVDASRHVIAGNEGSCVALAIGHYLATGEIAAVYMQNSGLGNAVNPIASLADVHVYGIPMLILVGWRGEPGTDDAPQHAHTGNTTRPLLDVLGIEHEILPTEEPAACQAVARMLARARKNNAPVALVLHNKTFFDHSARRCREELSQLTREAAIAGVVDSLESSAIVVATTGMASRELCEVRAARGQAQRDFLCVGGMGHASLIALGMATAGHDRSIYCLDGDGALIMHMGALATIGEAAPRNYKHVVLNNAAHDSVGGQPTAGSSVDFCAIARACGYRWTACVSRATELGAAARTFASETGPAMLELRLCRGARANLGRPTMPLTEIKAAVMDHCSVDRAGSIAGRRNGRR
jgi:phosphonopyruvate decarboxylase